MKVQLALGALLLAAMPLAAQEGAALYKAKCFGCHGATGEGKAAIAGSNLLTAEAKKRPDAEVKAMIAEGGKKSQSRPRVRKKGCYPQTGRRAVRLRSRIAEEIVPH